ncbi:hypothetical protein DES53_109161 [Roseimicrobium gellanilyticum]|uniref:Glycosyl transferase family 2 n=1 Tax=Roseimicrobium gellanilyticum TaxID=748857 RepID=A0A366HDN9_9BACT|nr:hypothetical protein [Roseimicrobium gellanilyticum]RBP39734.1 hypothetical protein DES53_109161 [Roseimicrobium gellanilyticum]
METASAVPPDPTLISSAVPAPRFSVIIPLEFHRGQGHDCLQGWTQGQDFPRDQFEIVLAIPPSFPEDEAAVLRTMLAPHDQAIDLPHEHDIALCAAAARHARGEILFFTESHCLPEQDVLTQAERGLRAHPEWAGFSCESVPITHNLLSKIEAGFYERDIREAMEHPWRNILDQCFVTTRKAYLTSGGFDGSLGHFAEWVLSARYRQHGLKLGYWPAARIHHYYIGEIDEWWEFTEDFTAGESAMLTRPVRDPVLSWFDENDEWAARHENSRGLAWKMALMVLRSMFSSKQAASEAGPESSPSHTDGNGRDLFRWLARGLLGSWAPLLSAHGRVLRAYALLNFALWREDREGAERALPKLCKALTSRRRRQLLRQHQPSHPRSADPIPPSGDWIPENNTPMVCAGFHATETWRDAPLRWSKPAAMVELHLQKGKHEVTLEWMPRATPLHIQFFINEKPLKPAAVKIGKRKARLRFRLNREGQVRLGWVCNPHHSPDDPRRAGVAVRRLIWAARS